MRKPSSMTRESHDSLSALLLVLGGRVRHRPRGSLAEQFERGKIGPFRPNTGPFRDTFVAEHWRPGGGRKNRMPHNRAEVEGADSPDIWLPMLERHAVQFLVLDPHTDEALVRLVRSRPGWRVEFDDGKAVVLARSEPTEARGAHRAEAPVGGRASQRQGSE